MSVDPSSRLVIGVSSRALFDLEQANSVYEAEGVDAFAKYQLDHVDDILAPGTGFPLIQAILKLNQRVSDEANRAEVVIISKNSPATSLRIFNAIKHYGLDIKRAVLSGGAPTAPYLHALHIDLYLSASLPDVQAALRANIAAGLIYPTPPSVADPQDQIRIAFDGDAVLFSDESEHIFQSQGLQAFLEHETRHAHTPLPEGPFAKLLKLLSELQSDPSFSEPPVRIALVSARGMPAHERVIRTLLDWNVRIDEAFFLGGLSKAPVLEAFRPHIFFDDQDVYCDPASKIVPTAKVFSFRSMASSVPVKDDSGIDSARGEIGAG